MSAVATAAPAAPDPSGRHIAVIPTEQPVTEVLQLLTSCFSPIPGNREPTLEITQDLIPSIQAEGQLVPGICYRDPDRPGHWIITAGVRRWFVCDLLGLPFRFIPIEGDTSPARVRKIAITDNAIRRNLSILEFADQIEQYATLTGVTCQARLAKELNLSPSEISRALLLPKKLSPSLHARVRAFQLPRTHAELISTLPQELQEQAAAHYEKCKPTRDAFIGYIGALSPNGKKPKTTRGCKGRTAGGLRFTFNGTPDAMVAEAKKLLKGLETLIANKWNLNLLNSVLPS